MNKKLNEYKVELSNKLLKLLNDEKKKEFERIHVYNQTKDPNEKANLMKELLEEKMKSKKLISEMNKEISREYKQYEDKLMNNNLNN